jgi:hypothetical protein
MKSLIGLIVVCLMILTARVAYDAGQREMRAFNAECGSPGVRCYMLLTPEYVETHTRSITLPEGVTAAFFDDDGRLRGMLPASGGVQ